MNVADDIIIQEGAIVGVLPQGKTEEECSLKIGKKARILSQAVIYSNNKIGDNFTLGTHALVREENTIGNNVSIGSFSDVEHHVTIEDDVRLHSYVFVPEFSVLKKGCWLGPRVTLTNAPFPQGKDVKKRLKGPIIREGAIIGAGAIIMPGITIGKNALVGSGSVVTRDVPARAVVIGNPAKQVKTIDELKYEDGTLAYEER